MFSLEAAIIIEDRKLPVADREFPALAESIKRRFRVGDDGSLEFLEFEPSSRDAIRDHVRDGKD